PLSPLPISPRSSVPTGHHVNPYTPAAGTVKFTEVDGLPGAEAELAATDKYGLGKAHHAGLHVGGRVALCVGVAPLPRHGTLEDEFHIRDYVGVCVFVDGDARRGVGHEDLHHALPHT